MYTLGPRRITPAVLGLLIANGVVFLAQYLPVIGEYLVAYGLLYPPAVCLKGQVWRLVSYMFLHATSNPFHLLFNMYALWFTGVELEPLWGRNKLLWFYFGSGIGAAVFSFLTWNSPIIGASGAILAMLTMYAYHFPDRTLLIFFLIPVPVRWGVAVFGGISLLLSMSNVGGIAHITHLGGILIALAYIKGEPMVLHWLQERRAENNEIRMRESAERKARDDREFQTNIDPILKKISEQGMDSLTAREKKALFAASKKHRERFSRGKIIPFDFK